MPQRPTHPDSLPVSFASRVARGLGRHRLLLLLLAADVASKVAAFGLLPDGEPVTVVPGLRLYLAVNEWGVMGGVHGLGPVTANPVYTMLLAVGLLIFAFTVLRLGASRLAFGWRVLAGTAVFFAVATAAQAAATPFARVEIPADIIIASIRTAALAVSVAFYLASSAALPRAAFTLLAAGALANAASYAYPPFQVVDFLVVPLQPVVGFFAGLVGRSATLAGDANVGVINFADVYIFLVPLLLLAWPLAALGNRGVATGRRWALG